MGSNLPWVYVHCAICETYVVYWFSRDLCLIGGGGGVNLPWVYVHCVIYETYLMYMVFQRSMLDWRMGGRSAGRSAKFALIYISCFASKKVFSYYI